MGRRDKGGIAPLRKRRSADKKDIESDVGALESVDIQFQKLDNAIIAKDAKEVKMILRDENSFDKAILKMLDSVKEQPLQKAARAGLTEIAQCLITACVDVSGSNESEAFILAASWGRVGVLQTMLEHKADLNAVHPVSQMSPLMLASVNGLTNSVTFLLNARANVNATRLGKSALSIAWSMNDLKIVRLLVESGANLSPKLWIEALSSANLCHTLASGFAEWKRHVRDPGDVEGMCTVPPDVVLKWIVHAPLAAGVLMNDVFIRLSADAPSRADLQSKDMIVAYSPKTVFDINDPEFVKLCPSDRGTATTVKVTLLEVEDPLRKEFMYAMSKSTSSQVFSSLGLHGTIRYGWEVIKGVFFRDIAIEFASLVTMLFWVIKLDARNRTTFYLRWTSWVLLLIITFREFVSFLQYIYYQSTTGDILLCSRTSDTSSVRFRRQWMRRVYRHVEVPDLINLGSSFVLLVNAGVVTFEDEQQLLVPKYLIFLSITASIRWLRLLQFLCSIREIGPHVLPIVKSVTAITSFLFVFFGTLIAFVHSTYWFNYNQRELFPNIIVYLIRQFFLGMISRWPVFMELMCSEYHRDYYLNLWQNEGLPSEYSDSIIALRNANDNRNMFCDVPFTFYTWQMMWYCLMAFVMSIVLLQVFVGVLSTAYREQLAQSYNSFLQFLAHTIAFNLITRSIPSETDEQKSTRKAHWKKLDFRQIVRAKLAFVLVLITNYLREITGVIHAPVKGQFLWICTPTGQLVSANNAQGNKLIEAKVNSVRDACKSEKESSTRLTDFIEHAENRIEHLFQESGGLDADSFVAQMQFNRKMAEYSRQRQKDKEGGGDERRRAQASMIGRGIADGGPSLPQLSTFGPVIPSLDLSRPVDEEITVERSESGSDAHSSDS